MSIGGGIIASGRAKEAAISAVVTRADGTVEDLGTLAYWHKNPLRRWAVTAWIRLRSAIR